MLLIHRSQELPNLDQNGKQALTSIHSVPKYRTTDKDDHDDNNYNKSNDKNNNNNKCKAKMKRLHKHGKFDLT